MKPWQQLLLVWHCWLTAVGFASLPRSTRHGCFCRPHVNGQPLKETCRYVDLDSYGASGARHLLPAEEKFCLPLDEFCKSGGAAAGAANGGGCNGVVAPTLDHQAVINFTETVCSSASECASLAPPVPPSPPAAAPAPILFTDRHWNPQKFALARQFQQVDVRCLPPCSTTTEAFLAVSDCVGEKSGVNGTAATALTGVSPDFTLAFDGRQLLPGQEYMVCVDADSAGSGQYDFEDSGLKVYVSAVAAVAPALISNSSVTVDLTLTCDGGCGIASAGYLATTCTSVDYGQQNAVHGISSASSFFHNMALGGASTTWHEAQHVTSPAEVSAAERFGASTAISGEFFVTGAPLVSSGAGKAFVYKRTLEFIVSGPHPEQWSQAAVLEAPGGSDPEGRFGSSVAVNGQVAAVGAPHRDSDLVTDATGRVHIYSVGAGGQWSFSQTIYGKLEQGYWLGKPDRFGWACSMDGMRLAVGAPRADHAHMDSGSVYIFSPSGAGGSWVQEQVVDAGVDAAFDDLLGAAIALSGSTLVVGAEGKDSSAGQAYVFAHAAGVWAEVGKLRVGGGTAGNRFGAGVGVAGSGQVFIGEPKRNSNTGALHVYFESSPGTWSLQSTLPGPSTGALFGTSVAVAGTTAATSAPGDGNGALFVYDLFIDGVSWSFTQKLSPGGSASAMEGFGVMASTGASVGLEAGRLVAGAPYADGGVVSGTGAAFVFELPSSTIMYTLTLAVDVLLPGTTYRLCTDLDGYSTDLSFGDTGLEVEVER